MSWIWTRIIKPILDFVSHIESIHTIQSILWPVVLTVSAAVSGFFGHEPVMWIIMATTLTFMGAAVGVLALSLHWERQNPLNKLQFSIVFQHDLDPKTFFDGNREQRLASNEIKDGIDRTLDKAQLGVEVFNTATFPVSAILVRAKTKIEGIEPPRSDFPKPAITVLPGARLRLCDDAIQMKHYPCGKLSGNIDVLIKYGHKGKETYELPLRGNINIPMLSWGFFPAVQLDQSITVS